MSKSETKYFDFEKDPVDRSGVGPSEIDKMIDDGWILFSTQKEAEATVEFIDRKGSLGEYLVTSIMPIHTKILVNIEENKALVVKCRNDINSDWRTLVKLNQ
jgi:hypothetical protein